MRISIFSLFRNSESYLKSSLEKFDSLVKETDADISFFFYENDSVDNTVSILKQWMKGKLGQLKSEKLNPRSFNSDLDPERMMWMSQCRNKMQKLDEEKSSDYSLIIDSDIDFDPNIINQFLRYKDLNFSMLTSNVRQDIPCKMGSSENDSYYDSSILTDIHGMPGMTWSYNPFYDKSDRKLFTENKPIKVNRAFGSCAFMPTSIFHNCQWSSLGESEHFSFCDQARKYGCIFLIPEIKPLVKIPNKDFPWADDVLKTQRWLLENKWNRFLWKKTKVQIP